MSDRLTEKTTQYERMLAESLAKTSVPGDLPADQSTAGDQCLEMAQAYLDDGRHFRSEEDLPNALAAFSYGHGWLDAGIRIGVLEAQE